MTSIAIIAVAVCCLIAFVVAVQAAREVELAKLGTACPCQHLTSLTVGSVHELPPGTVIPPATEADPRVRGEWERDGYLQDLAFAEKWIASGDPVMVGRGKHLKAWATEQMVTC